MSVHVYPVSEGLLHNLKGNDCACNPKVEYLDSETELPYEEGPLVVHNRIIKHKRHKKKLRYEFTDPI